MVSLTTCETTSAASEWPGNAPHITRTTATASSTLAASAHCLRREYGAGVFVTA